MSNQDLVTRREQLLGENVPLFYREPINIVRGEGVYLYDESGKQFIDMYNNVPCVGHCHPHVVEAMHRQASTLNVHSRYLHEGILDYAERLLGHHADGIERAVFACSGTEANEVAMAMARHATGGRGFICTDAAYHGNSREVSRLTRAGGKEDAEIRAIPYPQRYRSLDDNASEAELCELYLGKVREAIESFAREDIPLAGMLVCPILANEGLPDIPAGFMAGAAGLVRAAGGVFISDEVQAGMCRTGHWWGYEVMGVVPDIVSMGKPMGNGLPLSGVAASADMVNTFRQRTRYFNTFASSPLQAAAGSAVLDVIEDEGLRENAGTVGGYMRDALGRIQCESIGDIRGHGMFAGVEWVSDQQSKTPDREGAIEVANRLKDKGFLVSNAGALGNVVKVRPPLCFEKSHADLFLTAFQEVVLALDAG